MGRGCLQNIYQQKPCIQDIYIEILQKEKKQQHGRKMGIRSEKKLKKKKVSK